MSLLRLVAELNAELLWWTARVLSCRSDFRDPAELAGLLLVEDKHDVVCHALLSNDDALATVDDEIASLIVATFAMCNNLFFG